MTDGSWRKPAAEKGVKISGKHVATIKTKLKQASGSAAVASTPSPSAVTPAKKKPAKKTSPSSVKSTATKPAWAPARTAALSQHIANLKAAARRSGKDEAKRIIDLF
jgi:hypothetical protein